MLHWKVDKSTRLCIGALRRVYLTFSGRHWDIYGGKLIETRLLTIL